MGYKNLLLALTILALTGCVNAYETNYKAIETLSEDTPPVENPALGISADDLDAEIAIMFADGYKLIGYSSFAGPLEPSQNAVKQAKNIKSTVVHINKKYLSTTTGVHQITTPTTTTTYNTGTANVYGSGGYAFGNYSGTTTTYGTKTSYIPYSIDQYQQTAFFYAPAPPSRLGILYRDATNEEKTRANTNQTLAVWAVRKGSPAYKADLLPNDLILTINGQRMYDGTALYEAMERAEILHITLLRERKTLKKDVIISP